MSFLYNVGVDATVYAETTISILRNKSAILSKKD